MDAQGSSRVIVFIPVRGGSKSIPLKNIKNFLGKPLVHWVLSAANDSARVDRIVVSTDDRRIRDSAAALESNKLELHARAAETATDEASTESAMLDYLEGNASVDDMDIFVLLQATSPWTRSFHIDEALDHYHNEGFDSMLSVVHSHAFQWGANGTPLNYDYRKRPRRQNIQEVYQENGAIYINRVGHIRKEKNRLSGRIGFYPMHKYSAIELDDPEDWTLAEEMMRIYLREI